MPANQTRQAKRSSASLDGEINYYRLLGVDYSASTAEITRAYRTAMKRVHPDRVNAERRLEAEDRAKRLNEAFKVLSRPVSRERYDSELKAGAIQDQIMSRYFGGLGVPGSANDPFEAIRRAQFEEQKRQQSRNLRQATVSLFVVFASFLLVVVVGVVLWEVIGSILTALR